MINLTFSLILQASVMATGGQSYDEAYSQTMSSGQPLVVLVGADWCPGCRQMKSAVIPQLESKGGLSKVAFATVNTDQQGELANKLMTGSSIPQLIMYTKTDTGWARRQLTGAHSAGEVEAFLREGSEQPVKLSATGKEPTPTP